MLLNPCQLKEVAGGGGEVGKLGGDPSCFKLPGNWLPVVPSEEEKICLCCLLRLCLGSEYLMSPLDYADGSQVPVRGGY